MKIRDYTKIWVEHPTPLWEDGKNKINPSPPHRISSIGYLIFCPFRKKYCILYLRNFQLDEGSRSTRPQNILRQVFDLRNLLYPLLLCKVAVNSYNMSESGKCKVNPQSVGTYLEKICRLARLVQVRNNFFLKFACTLLCLGHRLFIKCPYTWVIAQISAHIKKKSVYCSVLIYCVL